jgi:hypothetical protein
MALQHPVYKVEIHGPGRGYHQAYTALEAAVHLPLASGYLVLGEDARARIMRHDHEGDARVTAILAGPGDVPDEDSTEIEAREIEQFVTAITGAPYHWQDDTHTWTLPGFSDAVHGSHAASRLEAALTVLATVLATQK